MFSVEKYEFDSICGFIHFLEYVDRNHLPQFMSIVNADWCLQKKVSLWFVVTLLLNLLLFISLILCVSRLAMVNTEQSFPAIGVHTPWKNGQTRHLIMFAFESRSFYRFPYRVCGVDTIIGPVCMHTIARFLYSHLFYSDTHLYSCMCVSLLPSEINVVDFLWFLTWWHTHTHTAHTRLVVRKRVPHTFDVCVVDRYISHMLPSRLYHNFIA